VSKLTWYAARAVKMSPREVTWRARDQFVQLAWRSRQVTRDRLPETLPAGERRFTATLPVGTAERVPEHARAAIVAAADTLMRGEWELFGVRRTDMADPDWFLDPVTGERSDAGQYAFGVDRRSGNIKHVWEPSRLQHLTLLAVAWYLTGDDRYAERVARQLGSWWRSSPFMSGVHWTSGIEIGLRLISFAWIRRLLDEWPGTKELFDDNPLAIAQVRWHCEFLATFRSKGTSANNHVIAEAAGLLVGASAFDWFDRARRWRDQAAAVLEAELIRNTFDDGVGRELATDYQCFIAELGILAAAEARAAGHPVSEALWQRLCAITDACAAMVDSTLRPPRQGDSDEGRAILLDSPADNRFPGLLRIGDELFGRLDWWPRVEPMADASSVLIGALANRHRSFAGRPAARPWRFRDAGITLLRDDASGIWCRCDGGPHGFLAIAAHAHADALSVEVRHNGVDVLADPGTYCYHGEPVFRSYFRSTLGHNTVELGGQDQSKSGGSFLWLRHANARETDVTEDSWTAEHDGYSGIGATHSRTVLLDRAEQVLEITDTITGGEGSLRLAFHLGPDIHADLDESVARLRWPGLDGHETATLLLPPQLSWSTHRAKYDERSADPVLGWYSPGLGRRMPATTLLGSGRCPAKTPLRTRLIFGHSRRAPDISRSTMHAEAQ
jgi:hypothetical protein